VRSAAPIRAVRIRLLSSNVNTSAAVPTASTEATSGTGTGTGTGTGGSSSGGSGRNTNSGRSWWGPLFFGGLASFTFALGVWQVQRRKWKIDLIAARNKRLSEPAIPLETALNTGSVSLSDIEFRRLSMEGIYDYANQFIVGLRSAPASYIDTRKGLPPLSTGYFIITPFRLTNPIIPNTSTTDSATVNVNVNVNRNGDMTGTTIMVNRGWVERQSYDRAVRAALESNTDAATTNAAYLMDAHAPAGQKTTLIGVARASESRPQYLPASYDPLTAPIHEPMLYADIPTMYERYDRALLHSTHNQNQTQTQTQTTTNAAAGNPKHSETSTTSRSLSRLPFPILIDALEPTNPTGQPPIRRRPSDYVNWYTTPELHVTYAATWFSLSAALFVATFIRFRKGGRVMHSKLKGDRHPHH
jgi:surfeit locus 1 family protein